MTSTSTLPSGWTITLPAQAHPGPTRQVRLGAMQVSLHGMPAVQTRQQVGRAGAAGGVEGLEVPRALLHDSGRDHGG